MTAHDLMATITTLEWLLLTTAVACLFMSSICLAGSRKRLRVFREGGLNGLRQLHARANVLRDWARFCASIILVSASVGLLGLPNDMDATAILAKSALWLLGLCMLAAAVTDGYTRREIAHRLEVGE